MRMNKKELVALGMNRIKETKRLPCQVAPELIRECWQSLSKEERKDICSTGLATLLGDALSAERAAWEKAVAPEVERIHDAIGCIFTSHQTLFSKRLSCVGHILRLPKDEQDKAIEEEVHKFGVMREGEMENTREFHGKLKHALDFYAGELLKSILLMASDGTMKTLLDFSLQDLEQWERNSKSKARAWSRRRVWFGKAKDALVEFDVAHVAELPAGVLVGLAEEAKDIWKDKSTEKRGHENLAPTAKPAKIHKHKARIVSRKAS